ncbi:MAG: hypothetical protein AB8I08_32065 [Sandaracinaceae bacterium]
MDESEAPLCPGGECVAGRCNLEGWDRTFGGSANEDIVGAAIDVVGNIYVLGEFADTLRFGAESVTPRGRDVFVASYSPTGAFR